MSGGPSDPTSVAVGYLEAFATGDPDAVAGWVSDDFVNEHTAALGEGCVGRDAYRERLPGFLGGFDGLRYEIETTIAEGDTVAVPYRMRATTDDKPIDIRGVMVIVVRGGKVARRTDYWDALTFLRQTRQA